MSWIERDIKTNKDAVANSERAQVLDKERATSLPTIVKEASEIRPFEPVRPQPVISPGIFEGEFLIKKNDIVFHFWPYGYHEADRKSLAAPKFHKKFPAVLASVMRDTFGESRVSLSEDADVGAWFVRAMGWGDNVFARELCVKACGRLHKDLGGSDS